MGQRGGALLPHAVRQLQQAEGHAARAGGHVQQHQHLAPAVAVQIRGGQAAGALVKGPLALQGQDPFAVHPEGAGGAELVKAAEH